MLYVIETVGDGSGMVSAANIEPEDVRITVSMTGGFRDDQDPGEVVGWLSDEVIEEHVYISEPSGSFTRDCDAVITVAGAPLPGGFCEAPSDRVDVHISVDQERQSEVATCPCCKSDFRETFENGGCTVCGFYFDGTYLTEARRAELDARREPYVESMDGDGQES